MAQGLWRLFFLLRDRVRAVQLSDLKRVAVERLLLANRTLGVYLPTDARQRAPTPAAERFDASPTNIDARTQRGRLGGNASGVQFALLPKPSVARRTATLPVPGRATWTSAAASPAQPRSMRN